MHKPNLKLVDPRLKNNPHDLKGVEWGSDQFIAKYEQAEFSRSYDEEKQEVEWAIDVMRSLGGVR